MNIFCGDDSLLLNIQSVIWRKKVANLLLRFYLILKLDSNRRSKVINQIFKIFLPDFEIELTLSQTTNFLFFQTESFVQTKILNLMKMTKFSKPVENAVGKGEIACNKQFLLFPQCFQKNYTKTCKNQGLFGKGLTL